MTPSPRHDSKRHYCSINKKTFSAQGWSSHVRACEGAQEAQQRKRKAKRARQRAFDQLKVLGQSPLDSLARQLYFNHCNFLSLS